VFLFFTGWPVRRTGALSQFGRPFTGPPRTEIIKFVSGIFLISPSR